MKKFQASVQIGKNGLTSGCIESIKKAFKTRENIRVRILKSAGHNKEKVKMIANEIVKNLGNNYTYRIVGFTIFIKKWRKAKR